MFRLKPELGADNEVGSGGSRRSEETEALIRSVSPTKRIVYTTTRPSDIKAPYEKMMENEVEFGSPDKRSGGFVNSALVSTFTLFCFLFFFESLIIKNDSYSYDKKTVASIPGIHLLIK